MFWFFGPLGKDETTRVNKQSFIHELCRSHGTQLSNPKAKNSREPCVERTSSMLLRSGGSTSLESPQGSPGLLASMGTDGLMASLDEG